MLFNEFSIQFKIAMVTIWIFPFLVLAALTRDWFLWLTKIVCSPTTVLLFVLAFLLLMIVMTDFESLYRMGMSIPRMASHSFSKMLVFFPGLTLVIVLGVLTAIFKPGVPSIFLVGFLALAFHVLYLMSVIILATQ
jgi:hypothetical protein